MGLIIRFLYRTCELPYYTGYRRTDSIRSSSSRIGKNPMRCTVFVGDKLAVARWTPYHKKKKIRGLGRFSSLGGGGRGGAPKPSTALGYVIGGVFGIKKPPQYV